MDFVYSHLFPSGGFSSRPLPTVYSDGIRDSGLDRI